MVFPSGRRETKRHAPPVRRSTSQTSSDQPVGPYQHRTSSGFVHASKTRLGGASKTRVMRTSRSEGVVMVSAPSVSMAIASACGTGPLLTVGLHLIQQAVEAL